MFKSLNVLLLRVGLVALSGSLVFFQPVFAESDKAMQEEVLKSRETRQMDHSKHNMVEDRTMGFRGVFYGYLPCDDCDGVKMTLSLKHKNNYLLVTQYARASSREYFDKGSYTWDDETRTVVLTSRKDGTVRHYRIKDAGTLVQLNADGKTLPTDEDRYSLRRSDLAGNREMHIH